MLKGIDPLLGPELLAALRAMGHGDEIAIVDANFPAAGLARRLVREGGIDAVRMTAAVAGVMPLDAFGPAAAFRMTVVDAPQSEPAIVAEFAAALARAGYAGPIEAVERFAFYEQARQAFVVVATGERRLYGNLILRKGVIEA
jgi:L-fucose mutarotase